MPGRRTGSPSSEAPVIAPSLGELLAGAVRWMHPGHLPLRARAPEPVAIGSLANQNHAERYAIPAAED
jgi:hypothetical protein